MWYVEHDILKIPNVMYKNIKYLFMSNSRISYSAIFLSLLKALPAYDFFHPFLIFHTRFSLPLIVQQSKHS